MSAAPFTHTPNDVNALVAAILNHPEGMYGTEAGELEETLLFAVFARDTERHNLGNFTLRTVCEAPARFVDAACNINDTATWEPMWVAPHATASELKLSRDVMRIMIEDMGIDFDDTANVFTVAILITNSMVCDRAFTYADAAHEVAEQLIDSPDQSPLPAAPNLTVRFNNIDPNAATYGHGISAYSAGAEAVSDAEDAYWELLAHENYTLPTGVLVCGTDYDHDHGHNHDHDHAHGHNAHNTAVAVAIS